MHAHCYGVDEDAAVFRVVKWLDHLAALNHRRLDLMRARSILDECADGLKCQSYEAHPRRRHPDSDGLLAGLIHRDEKRGRVDAELQAIADELQTARADLERAWTANSPALDAEFDYTLRRYIDGEHEREAAENIGVPVWTAKLYPRRCAPAIYAAMPWRFAQCTRGNDMPLGYY